MALQRRLLVGLGTASSLLLVYLLCLNLDSPLNVAPFRNLQVFVSRGNQSLRGSFVDSLYSFGSGQTSLELRTHGAHGTATTKTAHIRDESTVKTSTTTTTATTPARAKSTTKPGLNQPKPELNQPKPELNQPKPELNQPKPELNQPKLELNQLKPDLNQPKSDSNQAKADLKKPEPGPNQPKEDLNQPKAEPKASEGETKPGPGLKAGPTEPPFIGDSYFSDDAPPFTDCPSSGRTLVSQTDFKTKFRPDVPVLQWSKHLSPAQFQRLSQYPGAHGWGGVSYETLVETLSLLDSPRSGLLLDDWSSRLNGSRCIRCAVVGNGGILKDSKRGAEIDQHHYVFRTNGAIIKGFESDVGARTTHYTFSTNTLRNSLRSYRGSGYSRPPQGQETRYIFLPDHDRDYLLLKAAATHTLVDRGPERNIDPAQFFGAKVKKEQLKIYHPDFVRYLRNRFLRSSALKTKYKNIYRPSTGAVMLLAALHSCDQVSAYGFMTPDYSKYSDHYFDKTFHNVGFYINHDLRMEMSLWQQLHKAGLIRLYMHQEKDLKAQNQV